MLGVPRAVTVRAVPLAPRSIYAMTGLARYDLRHAVVNEGGGRIAEDGGLSVVMDRCIKVEHARYMGRMHWLGFNTQRITSVRSGLQ